MPTASSAKAQQLARLAAGDPAAALGTADKFHAIDPVAAAYNVFSPEYAKSLNAPTSYDPASYLNQRALRVEANSEQERYAQDLAAAQENERYLQSAAARYTAQQGINTHETNPDINTSLGVTHLSADPNSNAVSVDAGPAAVMNSENLNTQYIDRVAKAGSAVKDFAGAGYLLPKEVIGGMTTAAGQEKPNVVTDNRVPVDVPGAGTVQMNQAEAIEYYKATIEGRKADAAMIAAKASKYHAEHPTSSGAKTVTQYDAVTGRPILSTVTSPGSDPPDYQPNPKPDAHGSGASGKPSATTLPGINDHEVRGIGSQFGAISRTGSTAKHNAEVGGVPNSYHIDHGVGGHAIDIVPHKGVTKEQIADAYRKSGFTVLESINEGDHIHTALTKAAPAQHATAAVHSPSSGLQKIIQTAQAQKLPIQALSNGIGVRITFPNGVTRIYDAQGVQQ